MPAHLLPETGFVRLSTVLAHFPIGKSTWWKGVHNGSFPKPVKLTPRCTAWRAEDIHALIKSVSREACGVAGLSTHEAPPSHEALRGVTVPGIGIPSPALAEGAE